MGSRAAKSAPAPTSPPRARGGPTTSAAAPLPLGDGSPLGLALGELVRVVREEARAAVREELAAERARQAGPVTEEWLSTADVARRLGRSEKTVRYWIQARGLPARKHLGVWRVRRADLDGFIDGSGEAPERSAAAAILAGLHHS